MVGDGVGGQKHPALLHGLLVDAHVERVGGDDTDAVGCIAYQCLEHFALFGRELVAYPQVQHILQFEGILAEEFAGFFRIVGIHLLHHLLELWHHTHIFMCARAVFQSAPADGH